MKFLAREINLFHSLLTLELLDWERVATHAAKREKAWLQTMIRLIFLV